MKISYPFVVTRTLAPVHFPGNVDQTRVEVKLESMDGNDQTGAVGECRFMVTPKIAREMEGVIRVTFENFDPDTMKLHEFEPGEPTPRKGATQ